jgi:molybdopterin converting factor subunit 1
MSELRVSEENKSQIVVRVLFFGAARDAVGEAEIAFSLSNPTNVASAFEQVLDAFPDLRRFGRSLLFAVNEEYARPEREVFAGDELAVFPPVSGGAGNVVGVSLRGHPNCLQGSGDPERIEWRKRGAATECRPYKVNRAPMA